MTLHDYPSIVQAEIDRRYDLAGVDRHGARRSYRPRSDRADQANRADRPLGARRLVAYRARLLGGSAAASPSSSAASPSSVAASHTGAPSRSGAVRGIPAAAVRPRQL